MSARVEIEMAEIRKGDLIRYEFGNMPDSASEWRDPIDFCAPFRSGVGQHYLLNRPKEWEGVRIGWLNGEFAIVTHVLSFDNYRVERVNELGQPCRGEIPDLEDFVEAVAVPTEALDELRRAYIAVNTNIQRGDAIYSFFAAVDNASAR